MVSTDYPPIRGGISSLAWQAAADLARRGHDVEVVAPSWPGDAEHDADEACRVFRTPGYGWGYLRGLPLLARAAARLALRRPDVLLPMNVAYGGLATLGLRALGVRTPYVMFAYGLEFARFQGSPLMRRLYRRVYDGAERVFAVSGDTRRRLEDFGVRRRVDVMWPGVDLRRFTPEGGDFRDRLGLRGHPVIGTLSRLVERKGHDLVLRALPEVLAEFPEAVYLVVGDGPDRARLEALARDLGVAASVRFVGEVQEGDLAAWYRTCDLFVLPSREIRRSGHVEGFGIVFLEAGACGLPVVGGRSGGVVEAVEEGRTGLLVDPESPAELTGALLRMLRHPEEARALGRAGRDRAERQFTWERCLAPLGDLLEELPSVAVGAREPR